MSAATLDGAPAEIVTTPARRRPSRRAILVLGAAVVAAALGVAWLNAPRAAVSTDNAYLKTDRTEVAPRVKGQIAQVLVVDNQRVVAGQPLIRLDPSEYAARLASAEGDLALAQAQVASAQAALARLGAEQSLAEASTRQAETDIRAADAQSDRAQADWKRFQALVGDGTVARRDAERVHADALSASAAAEKDPRRPGRQPRSGDGHGRRRAELDAALDAARAAEAKARAALDLARQDADHAVIRAPIAGVVGDRQANPGDFVQPGARLLTLVPMETLYVTANFKETQTDRMLQGQPAIVRVDALPGVKLKAHVQSFAPGSGSEFALLPFEPGTGNFTKIVQRIPVRLTFDPGQAEVARLRPGLSAKVTVRLKD
ncbi:HlyD family secretion protein [Phenylobacterium aquaticum]|uniref:HlyD family secretion protein n=1 Tax=Phenylobacterium aquaticum TaxID=1763816 RepID=UPI001F5C127F|nr:HlyD family secretion protein [Phenylobacterium aquaticum]MCI3131623.1 HlyD family secretion protein [Phenylobacterium aquaticum]